MRFSSHIIHSAVLTLTLTREAIDDLLEELQDPSTTLGTELRAELKSLRKELE